MNSFLNEPGRMLNASESSAGGSRPSNWGNWYKNLLISNALFSAIFIAVWIVVIFFIILVVFFNLILN